MNTIKLTKKEMRNILDGEYIKGAFEKHYRHNGGDQEIIFERDGKFWISSYRWFEDDGIEWLDEYNAVEVKQVEEIVKVWKPI